MDSHVYTAHMKLAVAPSYYTTIERGTLINSQMAIDFHMQQPSDPFRAFLRKEIKLKEQTFLGKCIFF